MPSVAPKRVFTTNLEQAPLIRRYAPPLPAGEKRKNRYSRGNVLTKAIAPFSNFCRNASSP